MGGGSSTSGRLQELGRSQQAIVKLMMPLYFDPVDCTPNEHKIAVDCWNLVLTDMTPEFTSRKGTEGFPYTSCVTFFYDNFYLRLFDIHPEAKDLFKSGLKGQGMMLVKMLSLALSDQRVELDRSLLKLADLHYKKGVKAVEYGVVGDVMFWTLRKVMGDANYTVALHRVWVKIYSRMLKVLVPAAVALELRGDDALSISLKRDLSSIFGSAASVSLGGNTVSSRESVYVATTGTQTNTEELVEQT